MTSVQQAAFIKPGGKGKGTWGGWGGWGGKGWVFEGLSKGKGKGGWASDNYNKAQCLTHGKKRSMDCLTSNGAGGYVCKPESQCQLSSTDNEQDVKRGICSVHQKTRSQDCLTDDGAGGLCCLPDRACKQAGESAWGWGGGRKSGPNLPRTRVTEVLISGTVLEWKGKFGWIQPDGEVDHPMASKNNGRIYVAAQDLQGETEMAAGGVVQFHVYSDSSGLGAEEVYYTPP
eukprot:CAMPEP_0115244442 /NCGR_PEP_ID=MMETSP0270-20121206/39987_1 /TAXON_ID=71861 /ORGANISM="Scrippsiella trochoidea, Strain CCMP3099" /LENGTH=229 /DNA_ID=CAMNT_0002659573 /DNA_START=78 /DNA_END=767 /DNA_ORIENTATION=+